MTTYNLCLIGFGNIGRALARLLLVKRAVLRDNYSIEWRITGIATRRKGWIADPRGLDVEEFLDGVYDYRPLSSSPTNVQEWLAAAQADVLFEVSSLNVQTGQPAIAHLQAALEHGAHAITANKGPLVYAYRELEALARSHGKQFLFEATVMGGSPTFSLFRETLPALTVLRVRGILNSTTNVILEAIEQGRRGGADVVLTPELSLCGYPPEDLVLRPAFLSACERELSALAPQVKDVTALIGFPEHSEGRRYNAVAVIRNGRIEYVYRKHCLPNYTVFDEERYFTPGSDPCVFEVAGEGFDVSPHATV